MQTLNIQTKYAENKKKNLISTNYQNRLGKTIKNQNRLHVNRKKQQLLA